MSRPYTFALRPTTFTTSSVALQSRLKSNRVFPIRKTAHKKTAAHPMGGRFCRENTSA
jgi:hypothetical protein